MFASALGAGVLYSPAHVQLMALPVAFRSQRPIRNCRSTPLDIRNSLSSEYCAIWRQRTEFVTWYFVISTQQDHIPKENQAKCMTPKHI